MSRITAFKLGCSRLFQNIADTISDINFVVNTVEFSRALASAKAKLSGFKPAPGRHYLYLFNHYPASKAGLTELRGSHHGDDISFEFDPVASYGSRAGFGGEEYVLASTFRTMLTSFAKTGSVALPGAGIMEADDRQVTTVFTVQPPFHHRHSTNRVS